MLRFLLLLPLLLGLTAPGAFAKKTKSKLRAAIIAAAKATPAPVASVGPTIQLVRGKQVRVSVPEGFKTATLQRSAGQAGWVSIETKVTDGTASSLDFELDRPIPRRLLRVVGSNNAAISADLLGGPTIFLAPTEFVLNGMPSIGDGRVITLYGGVTNFQLNNVAVANNVAGGDGEVRTVSESDIWRVEGDRLYFFNDLRGLQVFDISDPDHPGLLGQTRTPEQGERMYMLDEDHVVLITRGDSYLYMGLFSASFAPSSLGGYVVVVDVKNGKPRELARVPFAGSMLESRLVGDVLYVASSGLGGGLHSKLHSFDLRDRKNPVLRQTLDFDRWGTAGVMATDEYFFFSQYNENWTTSTVQIVDISATDGSMVAKGEVQTAGVINDKFKLRFDGEVLTTVSAINRRWTASGVLPSSTMVETWSLADPAKPVALGSLELGVGETVRAARFDGDRLYVVTFFTIDPLWVIDLSIPSTPTLLAELEVPGFSTYVQPLGDRLVSVGRIGNQVAVSLFDIADPLHPALLSQLPLGDNYSTSEANWDEKAFTVLPEENLILVPYSGYEPGSGYANRVQLIDLDHDGLVKRGITDHGFAARRTAVVGDKGDRAIGISSTNLVTFDISNRDKPRVTSDVEISWSVDRVLLAGDYLVQITGTLDAHGVQTNMVTITKADNPDSSLGEVDLGTVPVVGATINEGRLYVAQAYRNSYGWFPVILSIDGKAEMPKNFHVSVVDLTSLPEAKLLGRLDTYFEAVGDVYGDLDAAWPAPGTLVWTLPENPYIYGGVYPYPRELFTLTLNAGTISGGNLSINNTVLNSSDSIGSFSKTGAGSIALNNPSAPQSLAASASAMTVNAGTLTSSGSTTLTNTITSNLVYRYYRYDNNYADVIAVDVSQPAAPKLAAVRKVRAGMTREWSKPFASGGKLYLGYQAMPDAVEQKITHVDPNSPSYRYYLKTVDFSDPTAPVISEPVNIPGKLLGTARNGAVLFTTGPEYDEKGKPGNDYMVHASGFDGTLAHLLDQAPLSYAYSPIAVQGETIFVANYSEPGITVWKFNDDEEFEELDEIDSPTDFGWANLAIFHGLLVQQYYQGVRLFDVTNPAAVVRLGEFRQTGYGAANFSRADGHPDRGLWIPLGSYGVQFIELAK